MKSDGLILNSCKMQKAQLIFFFVCLFLNIKKYNGCKRSLEKLEEENCWLMLLIASYLKGKQRY